MNWKNEPNNETFEYKGFVCEIKRHKTMKHLCGYVYIPEGHPAFNNENTYSIHGGITFCQVDVSGEWCLGFDCGHAGDLSPGLQLLGFQEEDYVYRDWQFVTEEIHSLVNQLIEEIDESKQLEYQKTIKNRLAIKLLSQ